jgi:phosphatidylserine decarboxylase
VFAPGAGRFLGPPGTAAVVIALLLLGRFWPSATLSFVGLLALAVALTVFFAVFFRDPERVPGAGIVSAADGRVRAVEREGDLLRISVFMNVTNVHVNRYPLDGRVEAIATEGSAHRPAYLPDAGHNVRRSFRLSTTLGTVEVVQVTGVLARRLVSFVSVGSVGQKADRFGMIILGSRVDVLLPAARVTPTVEVGQTVRAGTTTIARELS